MFIVIIVIVLFLTWKYADWRNWRRYHSTMLLFSMGNLFYNFVYHNHFLWRFEPDVFNHHIIEVIYSFSVYPLIALLFLSGMPDGLKKKLLHIAKYAAIFAIVEYILFRMERMVYDFGWGIELSACWDIIMFTIMAIHHKKPLIGYGICLLLALVMNWAFPFYLI